MKNKPFNLRVTACLLLLCIALFAITGPLSAQDGRRVTGHVIDDLNEPLIGASILVVGTGNGVITDLDGNFSILVPPGATTLQISYVGYETMTVSIPAGNVVNVKMQSDAQMLSDVVVIGYGTQRKSDLTGSVSNVSSKDFNAGLISSPEQLINGKVSGVQIMSNSGNFLALINPGGIESMTILKDASSTAIYGSRASNGVIIITTDAQLTADFILDERARELYLECVRRTDLIRYGKFTTSAYLWQWKGGLMAGQAVDSKYNMYPIPSTELTANPNLYNENY